SLRGSNASRIRGLFPPTGLVWRARPASAHGRWPKAPKVTFDLPAPLPSRTSAQPEPNGASPTQGSVGRADVQHAVGLGWGGVLGAGGLGGAADVGGPLLGGEVAAGGDAGPFPPLLRVEEQLDDGPVPLRQEGVALGEDLAVPRRPTGLEVDDRADRGLGGDV